MERIPLTDEQKQMLIPLINEADIAMAGFTAASTLVKMANDELFKAIFEMFPQSAGRRPQLAHPEEDEWYIVLFGGKELSDEA